MAIRRRLVLGMALGWSAAHAQSGDALRQQQERLQEFVNRSRAQELLARVEAVKAASRFAAVLRLSGLAPQLQELPELTVFVPVDEAWGPVPQPATAEAAQAFVRRHALARLWGSRDEPGASLATLGATALDTTADTVGGVSYELQGLRIRNGVIHLMGGILP